MKNTGRNFILAVTLILIFIMAARTALDTDMWWHLRSGEVMIETRTALTSDIFSHTRYGENWINHSWLSQVFFYLFFLWAGYTGVSLLVALSAVVSMFILTLQLKGNPLMNAFILIFGGFVASVNWVPRPQVISLVFLAVTVHLLYLFQSRSVKVIWWFLPLFLVWGNIHGGYPLGLILIGCAAAGEAAETMFAANPRKTWKEIGSLIAAAGIGYLLTVINPNGFETWLIPFQTVSVQGLQNLISEWASPDFHDPIQLMFLLYFFFVIWSMVLSKKEIRLPHLLTLSIFGLMVFWARRNFGPFVIVTIPMASSYLGAGVRAFKPVLPGWLRNMMGKSEGVTPSLKVQKLINYFFISFLLLTGIFKLWAVNRADFVSDYVDQNYPVDAVNWLQQNTNPGPVLNEYNWGGFLTWYLDDYPVYIDGRTDLYGDEIINEWLDIVQCGENWQTILAERNVRIILLTPERPLVRCASDSQWEVVFQDQISVILMKADQP